MPALEGLGGGQSLPAETAGQRGHGLILAMLAAIVASMYWSMGFELVEIWNLDPNYSHGFLVPLGSLCVAYLSWRKFGIPVRAIATRADLGLAVGEMLGGLMLHFYAAFSGNLLLDVASLLLVLRGMTRALGGGAAVKAYGFAIFFLIFMAPLPASWYQPLARQMQQVVALISLQFLEVCGIPAFREGYLIHLPGYTMEVGEACSGLRQLTAVLTLAVAVGFFSARGWRYRWTLALLAIPISVAANCLRVMLTGVIMMLFGRQWAEGVYHTLEGLAIVALAASLILLAAWLMAKVGQGGQSEATTTA